MKLADCNRHQLIPAYLDDLDKIISKYNYLLLILNLLNTQIF